MTPGTYKRTGWQRRKASMKMKKIWAARRKSAAMKAWHEKNKANGGVHPAWKKPYKNAAPVVTGEPSLLNSMFGPNLSFKDLTTEQKRQYWKATDQRRKNPRTVAKPTPMQTISQIVDNAHKVRIESNPQELIIRISVEGNTARLKDIRLSPSQTA